MENQVKFTKTVIVSKLLGKNKDLRKYKLLDCKVDQSKQIDGFMGNIIFLTLEFEVDDFKIIEKKLVVKLMKPPSPLRSQLGGDIMFCNELFIYKDVIPTFISKFQDKFRTIDKELWCPHVLLAESGIYPALSDETETLLVLENLTPKDYRLGHRINLSEQELRLMCKAIAQYHACTYAMRINGDPDLEKLVAGLTPIPFTRGGESSMTHIAYNIAIHRLLTYLEENPEEMDSDGFRRNIECLRKRYKAKPAMLMQRFLRNDEVFSVILHGDYNRNNVLFKYEMHEDKETAVDLRFIDFQEVRYGTPAIDVSFFLFMNMEPLMMENGLLLTLIKYYHNCLMDALSELLEVKKGDEKLKNYSWDNFYNHFKQFGFYGAMVAVLFVPWMACPKEECEQLQAEFEKDIHSEEFRRLSLTCGGKAVNQRITKVVRHANSLGFMEMVSQDDS